MGAVFAFEGEILMKLIIAEKPSAHDEKYLKWNNADMPIIPSNFEKNLCYFRYEY